MAIAPSRTDRISSLDQFRGYTVAGMFLVNFAGSFDVTPVLLTHQNNFCSYADTVMPQFFFAVGFAFRLTFARRVEADGAARAYRRVLQRIFGLALIAMVIYTVPPLAQTWEQFVQLGLGQSIRLALRAWFQTLMHIAVTSLWILPVIRASGATRVAFAVASAALHVAASHWFYYDWVQTGGIDGGVLGFLTWTIPMIAGTLACDAVMNAEAKRPVARLFAAAALMMLAGWLLSCGTTLYDIPPGGEDPQPTQKWAADPVIPFAERLKSHDFGFAEPPFVPPPGPNSREENYWMMSQRAGTLSYHIFAAGVAIALYGVFYGACDVWGFQVGIFRTLGANALVGYVLHGIVGIAMSAFMPEDAPAWYVAAGFVLYFSIIYLFLRSLEKDKIFIKL
jgi:predicted acyltransferase